MSVELTSGRNVLGGPLRACAFDPLTGYFRDGCCRPHPDDLGKHASRYRYVVVGGRWCVSAVRWLEALEAGVAPPVALDSTHDNALDVIPLEILQAHAIGVVPPTA